MKAPDEERALGIEWYATSGDRCRGKVKALPEDFRVEEAVSLEGLSKDPQPGGYPLYRVRKRGIDTMRMAVELSKVLKSRVSYGGLKDSRAVATQYATPTSTRSERPGQVAGERFTAELVGYLQAPLTRGSVVGNRFDIVVRDCCGEVAARIEDAMAAAKGRRVPNYFGMQRFGATGRGTHLVGRALVRADFQGAVRQILAGLEGRSGGHGRAPEAEELVERSLRDHPGDPLRALRAVPLRLRRLYVQAFQSFIFNRSLSRALVAGEDISRYQPGDNWASVSGDGLRTSYPHSAKEHPEGDSAPLIQLPGFGFRDYGSRFDPFVKQTLAEEGVDPRQFYIKEMQETSAEGSFRRAHLAVADPSWRVEGNVASMGFALGRGQYATILLREILKPDAPAESGLA